MGRGMKFLDSPTGISLDFSGSFEIFWNFVTIFTPIHRDNWGFITGIGLDWRNYVMNDNRYFTKQNGQIKIVPCPEDAHLDFSRLKTVDLTIPLLIEWQTRTFFAWSAFLFAWPGYRYKDIQQHENQIYCRKRKSTVFQ